MKERNREERGIGKKVEKQKKKNTPLPPPTLTCCKDSRPCPTVSQYQLDALVTLYTQHLRTTRPPSQGDSSYGHLLPLLRGMDMLYKGTTTLIGTKCFPFRVDLFFFFRNELVYSKQTEVIDVAPPPAPPPPPPYPPCKNGGKSIRVYTVS